MSRFGWAHISNAKNLGSGGDGAIQFVTGSNGEITGSTSLVYDYANSNLILSGNIEVSGTLKANVLDVITTTKTEIDISGNTNFGNDNTDQHVFTGSISIVSGGLRQHYSSSNQAAYAIEAHDSIIGLSATSAIAITLPSAATAGAGKILIIKDETASTRSDSDKITVSAAGGQTIDGSATYDLSGDNPALTIYSNGISKWFIY
jgi:hypothetical protein